MKAEERIKQLTEGKAVVVNVSKEGGVYKDPVAKWAEENGLLAYCGNRTRVGHERTPWFNPHHKEIEDKGRDWVCDKFEAEVLPGLDLSSLKGRALGCWCFPERCHCDSIAAKVNGAEHGIGHNSNALKDIATRARLALEQVDAGEKQTMEGWLQYGTALNEGREMFPKGGQGDKDFGAWMVDRQLAGPEDHERTAAMWAAANPKEFESIKEANPRVRTVRGLHAKWKEEQKAVEKAVELQEAWERSEEKRKQMEANPAVFDIAAAVKSKEHYDIGKSATSFVVAMEQMNSKSDKDDIRSQVKAAIEEDPVKIKVPALFGMKEVLDDLCGEFEKPSPVISLDDKREAIKNSVAPDIIDLNAIARNREDTDITKVGPAFIALMDTLCTKFEKHEVKQELVAFMDPDPLGLKAEALDAMTDILTEMREERTRPAKKTLN